MGGRRGPAPQARGRGLTERGRASPAGTGFPCKHRGLTRHAPGLTRHVPGLTARVPGLTPCVHVSTLGRGLIGRRAGGGAKWEGEGRLHSAACALRAWSGRAGCTGGARRGRGARRDPKVEKLRGLRTIASARRLDARCGRHAAASCCACSSASASRRATPAGTTRCTCSASCGRGRASSRSSGVRSTGQVAGLYVPRTRRLYVLGSGGSAPRAVIAHEVVHALQDEHFQLTRGPFAPRPRDHDGELAAQALVEGDATEVQSRYIAALSPVDLIGELGRTLARGAREPADGTGAVPRAPAGLPLHRGTGVRARPACARRAAPARPRLPPPSADDRRGARSGALSGRGSAAPGVRLPAGSYRFATSFGAEDLVALTGKRSLARSWLGGRMGVGRGGLDLRLATRGAASVAAALRRALPARGGGRVPRPARVRADRAHKRFSASAFPADRDAVEPSPGRGEAESAAERRLHAVVDTLGLHVYSGETYPDDRFVTTVALTPSRSLLGLVATRSAATSSGLPRSTRRTARATTRCSATRTSASCIRSSSSTACAATTASSAGSGSASSRTACATTASSTSTASSPTSRRCTRPRTSATTSRSVSSACSAGSPSSSSPASCATGRTVWIAPGPRRRAHARRAAARGRGRADRLVRVRASGRPPAAGRLPRAARAARAGRGDLSPARARRRRALGLGARTAACRRRARSPTTP